MILLGFRHDIFQTTSTKARIYTMASQDAFAVPFSASREQQPVKLLELPPELLAVLEAADPPTCVGLVVFDKYFYL